MIKLFRILLFVSLFLVMSHIDYNDTIKNLEYKNIQEYNKTMYTHDLQVLCEIHNDTQACDLLGK